MACNAINFLYDVYDGMTWSAIIEVIGLLMLASFMVMNMKGSFELPKILSIFFANFQSFFLCYVQGTSQASYLYLFPYVMAMIFFLRVRKNDWFVISFLSGTLLALLITVLLLPFRSHIDFVSDSVNYHHLALNIIVNFLLVIIFFYFVLRLLDAKEKKTKIAAAAKARFMSNMSHELRTPLNAIIGFSELIRDQNIGRTDNKYAEWAGIILSSGQHLLDIINDVLELSRIETVGPDCADGQVDLATVIATAVGMLELQAKANGVYFDCMLAEAEAVLRADQRAVKQVVLNLLANAVKFTPGGGRVSIRIESNQDGGLVLVVSDPGVGIDQMVIASLCEPFTQANSSISRRFGGTGLGLAISQRLVVMHGGTLTIESALGQGTTVRANFPADRVVGRR